MTFKLAAAEAATALHRRGLSCARHGRRGLPPFTPPRTAEELRTCPVAAVTDLAAHPVMVGAMVALENLNRYQDLLVNTLSRRQL